MKPLPCPWCRKAVGVYYCYVACDNPNCWSRGPRRTSKLRAIRAWNSVAKAAQKGRKKT